MSKDKNKTKNKLIHLNDHLFEQIEKLNDDDLVGDRLVEEIGRSKAISGLAVNIIGNAKLALDAQLAIDDRLLKDAPPMLGADTHDEKKKKG